MIAVWRVVNYDRRLQGSAHPLHVFNELAVVKGAIFSEESLRSDVLLIQNIHQRDCIFRKGSSKNDDFKVLAHLVYEFTAVGPDLHINVVHSTFYIDWQHNVCLVGFVE